MGYLTEYTVTEAHATLGADGSLSCSPTCDAMRVVAFHLRNLPYFTGNQVVVNASGVIDVGNCKWYRHDEDVRTVLEDERLVRVVLHHDGEEQGDVWDKVHERGEDRAVTVKCYRYRLVRDAEPS